MMFAQWKAEFEADHQLYKNHQISLEMLRSNYNNRLARARLEAYIDYAASGLSFEENRFSKYASLKPSTVQ